jgi:capsular exopolysaccharide synthesis family protein
MLNLVAGVLVGLLIGFLLAWVRARLDRGLHSSEEAERILDVPALATIPVRRRFSTEDPVLGEAYDMLRANLAFLSYDRDLRVLTVSSFNPREGKSSTVEGLAHAATRGGLDVLMIDGDVRTRSLSERLGHADKQGLTNAIVGQLDAEDATIQLAPGLAVLPAGPVPPNPPGLFSATTTRDLFESLRERYSLVLVDSPPIAHLADASILASMSDGIVMVARVGVTARSDLVAAAASLRQVPTPVVGVVVLERRQIDETYYPAASKGFRVVPPAETRPAADAVEKL